MADTLFTSIARTLTDYIRAIDNDDGDAANKHRATLVDLQSWLPADAGINNGCEIDIEAVLNGATAPSIKFYISVPFQASSGWCTFTVIAHACMVAGVYVVCECNDDGIRNVKYGDAFDSGGTPAAIAARVEAALRTPIQV